jgi:tripartite-type tricarboxylate transporter receptor subunit TctC
MRGCFAAIVVFVMLGAPAQAQNYPDRPVKIITDSAPGSATDTTARLTAERLSQIWGHQVVVENRPGANGSLAVRAAMSAAPDGYTLYVAPTFNFIAPEGVAPNLPIELPRDFTQIGFMTMLPMFIAVSPKIGVKSLPELIAVAKQKPGKLSYAATGRGRITNLTMELLQKRADIKLQMVPYTGGPAAAMSDLATGRVDVVLDGYSGLAGGLSSGLIRAIAVASPDRLNDFKDLPTVAETLPDFLAGGWNVLLAPVGTPDGVVEKISIDLRKALDDTSVKSKLAALGVYVRSMTPAEVQKFVQEQQATWRPITEKVAKEIAAGK